MARACAVVGVGGVLFNVLVAVVLSALSSYGVRGRVPCFGGLRAAANAVAAMRDRRAAVGGRSVLAVAISSLSPLTTTPFGLPLISCDGPNDRAMTSKGSLRPCVISGSNCVAFPMVKGVGLTKVGGSRTVRCVGGDLSPCLGSPVVAVRFAGCQVSVLNRMHSPNTCAVDGRRIAVLSTLTVTNSVALCKHHRGMLLVERGSGKSQRCVQFGLGGASVVSSPCFCLRRGSIVCIRPGTVHTATTSGAGISLCFDKTSALTALTAIVVSIISLLGGWAGVSGAGRGGTAGGVSRVSMMRLFLRLLEG